MKKEKQEVNITVHRGLDQIGGCITEISTETSRIFVDMGQNLPGRGKPSLPGQDKRMVGKLFKQNVKQHEAVVYTHAHEDHVGLFRYVPDKIPQHIASGAHEILLAKYQLIKQGHELEMERKVAEKKAEGQNETAEKVAKRFQVILKKDELALQKLQNFITWERTKPHAKPHSFEVGDIRITPFFTCHSIYDSYMLLIEAGGKRIWHTGDYREHGYMGKGLVPTLKRYATDIDVLITEGTMLNREDECVHECEVSRRMASVMGAFKYVVVLASATDIERLASVKEAAAKAQKDLYICSGFMKRTMQTFTRREADASKGLFAFHPKYVGNGDTKITAMKKKGFVLVTGVGNQGFVENLCKYLNSSDVLFIYSTWDGYYKDPAQVKENPRYKQFRDAFQNVVDIHTSGHADRETIKKVIETVHPKLGVIGIHKEADQLLKSLDLNKEIKIINQLNMRI